MDFYNFVSFIGIFAFMFAAWLFSNNHKIINWRVVIWGVIFQLIFAFIIFRFPAGVGFFNYVNNIVIRIFAFAKEGIYFLFGPLAISPGIKGPNGEESIGFILAIQALPTIIFFSSLMALLYHIGFMQMIVSVFSKLFARLMKISGAESLCSASNIFVGIESMLTIRPYIETMTKSEFCTILTAGMATVASTVLGIYVSFLQDTFPTIAGHLISASILSAPAAIVMSKLIFPETEKPKTMGEHIKGEYLSSSNWIEAIIRGANEGVRLCVGICALLLAFLGLLAMVNGALLGVGKLFHLELSLQGILAYLFKPLAFFCGIAPEDVNLISKLFGERAIVTEMVAYQHLAEYIREGLILYPRSVVIASYILCGFSHIASLAIFVGGTAALAPKRAREIASLGFRALFAATLACLMTGAVAGIFFYSNQTVILIPR
ncbi:MAG: nucleoside transporter [Candidatus Omnitrophica bacterium]|nr:nucleoside transporter [Candidatus Omnitrophota bacterium]